MIVNNVGFNHSHDSDFFIERPEGSGDNLLLLLKTDAIFTLDGREQLVPKNSFFLYRRGTPQYYRCVPQHTFSNDWMHFLFEGDEEAQFFALGLRYEQPVQMDSLHFLSFCVKSIAGEAYSQNLHRQSNIRHFLFLIFNKVSEQLHPASPFADENYYEVLSTIRNKIYSEPYIPRTVDWVSHEVRMSRSNFQLLYKKYFGVSFVQDLINSRLEYAQMLLLSTNLRMEEIAGQCGYNNYAHFARQFRQNTGMTPQGYRRAHKQAVVSPMDL